MKRFFRLLLLGLLMFAPLFAQTMLAQSDVFIETPHARTVSSAERTMFYDITTKNAGTLSASSDATWLTASISDTRLTVRVATNLTSSARYGNVTITDEISGVSQTFTVTQKGNDASGASLSDYEDTRYIPSSATATSSHSDNPFRYTYDKNYSTFWHTNYGSTITPPFASGGTGSVTCTWNLGSSKSVDFITYVPRSDSQNGNWGKFTLSYSTDGNSYTTIGTYDFGQKSTASSVDFSAKTARFIRVVITSGYANHASCSEFIIGKRVDVSTTIGALFQDDLWTKLKSSVTQTQINGITNTFVKNLAQAIYDGGYSTTYRVHTAYCYKSPDVISAEWNAAGKYYDRTGNVTGISVPNNSKIAVWIPSIPSGAELTLMIRSWYPGQKTTSGEGNMNLYNPITCTYSLHQGLNIVEYSVSATSGATDAPSDGLAYVAYFGDTDDQYDPVPMHFLNGVENGYLSLDLTNDQMHNLCKNAPNMHMDVVSEHAHMVWEAQALYNYCRSTTKKSFLSTQGTEKGYRQYIRLMEYLISSEHKALGLQKYNRVPKTRTLAYVNYYYFMFQYEYGVSFCYDVQETCLDLYKMLKADDASVWGISHEWGHQHQMRPYFNWAGCDESTNNYNSMWNTVSCGLTDMGHGCHPAFGTILYNGTASGKLSANCATEYTQTTNTRQYAYESISDVSWNSDYTALVRSTYNNHLNWTNEAVQNDYSFDYSNYDSARPFLALSFYMMDKGGLSDFSYDLFEAIRQTDKTSGSSVVGSTIEKTGVDKYELLAAAQNGNATAYSQFNSDYSSSVWRTKNYLSDNASRRTWDVNSVPFIFNYIRKASRLSGYNLVPYFKKCGMLRTVAYRIHGRYSDCWYLMTADMLSEFESDMNALGLKTCDDNMVKAILTVANPNWSLPSTINNN